MEAKQYTYTRKYVSVKTGETKYYTMELSYTPKKEAKPKLTETQIQEIKELLLLGVPTKKIANRFNTTYYRVYQVRKTLEKK